MRPSFAASVKYALRASTDVRKGPHRNSFMRDRDRILYSRPFRRLSKKTQIFLPISEDHVRTRLTHTLEVAQIATTAARALRLDRDLSEAVALGHDLGHTPFGHSGEKTLNLIMNNCDDLGGLSANLEENQRGFKHNLQGVRLAAELTSLYESSVGLNLTNYTLWGIHNHTEKIWNKCDYTSLDANSSLCCNLRPQFKDRKCSALGKELQFYNRYNELLSQPDTQLPAWSFEAFLVRWTDEIAQRHHDIEDGLIANVIDRQEILIVIESILGSFLNREERRLLQRGEPSDNDDFVPRMSKIIVGCLNRMLIKNSMANLRRFRDFHSIKKYSDFVSVYPKLNLDDEISDQYGKLKIREIISFHPLLKKADKNLHEYLKGLILNSYEVQRMDGKARFVLRQIAKAYLRNPQQLPNSCVHTLFLEHSGYGSASLGDMRNWLNEKYYSQEVKIKQSLLRIICDQLSGMTDEFALREHERLYSSSEYVDLRHY